MTVKGAVIVFLVLNALADLPEEALLSNLDFFLNMEVVEDLDTVIDVEDSLDQTGSDIVGAPEDEGEKQ